MQDLVGIGVADAAQDSRIRQRALESPVLGSHGPPKLFHTAAENLDPAWVQSVARRLPPGQVYGGAALGTSLGQYQGAAVEIQGRKMVAPGQLGARRAPMQASRDHQMNDDPYIVVEAEGHALADALQA